VPLKGYFRSYLRIWRLACLGAGPALLLVALGFAIYTAHFIHSSAVAEGKVLSLREVVRHSDDVDQHESITYAPVFTFKTADGASYTVSSDTGSSPAGFTVGDTVRVLYSPSNPSAARIDTFAQLWFTPMVFGCLGVGAIAAGLLLLDLERRRSRREQAQGLASVR
jgi:hypothetical protein